MPRVSLIAALILIGPICALTHGGDSPRFDRAVRPILSNHCFTCHGPDEETREAELRLDTREGLYAETASGAKPIAPGDVAGSELLRRITSDDPAERMPPAESGKPLSSEQIATLKKWVAEGAQWKQHWAYTPPARPAVPEPVPNGDGQSSADHPIDRFVRARLASEGLAPSAQTDAVTLARRLAFDLTGLPPTNEQVGALVGDSSPKSYARLVDELLSSPHYGERMAQYWLDLVRYADSCGYHSDVEHNIWPYRDYVIAAFNDNMPFDRFTREQLAGDLLPDPTLAQRIATGFNRLNKTTEEGGAQAGEYLAKSAADRVRTVSGVWLAATVGCAECHDHKYDPYTARDFYSLAAFFADVNERGVYSAGNRGPEVKLPTPEQTAELEQLKAELNRLTETPQEGNPEAPEPDEATKKQIDELKAARAKLEKSLPRSMVTVAVEPRVMRILPRGNWLDETGEVVEPAIPAFLVNMAASERRLNRLDLAEWLVARDNPLVARVFVNRMWKLFFGAGLSKHLDDLGSQGEPPSHPELLDWLAVEFIESGWDIKHLVRLLLTSESYQQTSVTTPEQLAQDPQNRLLARQSRWRLDAEFVRDQALSASGLLVPAIGGPSVKPYQPDGYWDFMNFPKRKYVADEGERQHRRGLYTHWQRTFLHPSLLAFDAPSREECTAERPTSNTPKAALVLLNDPTYVEAARSLAATTLREGGTNDAERIGWAWRRVLSRLPEPDEERLLAALLAEARGAYLENDEGALAILGVGQADWPRELAPTELAAWTSVARAVLNVSEAVTRN